MIVFEFSVILHLIDKGQRGEPLSIREACRQALFSLKGIRNLQLPFCTLYFALFLPAAHLVYINALIPRLRVPEFVIGELRLTVSGRLLISAFWLGLYGLAIFLLFVPLLMIFRRMKLSQAIKQNLRLWKQLSAKEQGTAGAGLRILVSGRISSRRFSAQGASDQFRFQPLLFKEFNPLADVPALFNAIAADSAGVFPDEPGLSVFSGPADPDSWRRNDGRGTGE